MAQSELVLKSGKRIYLGIDLFKIIISLFIVFFHTYCYDWGAIGLWVKSNLSQSGVPFFFIISGFFFWKGINNSDNAKLFFKKNMIRIGMMYFFWFFVTLPISWYTYVVTKPDESTLFRVFRIVRSFFLSGGMGVYWYLLSLLCVFPIFFIMFRHTWIKAIVFPTSVVFFAVGVLYFTGMIDGSIVYNIIHIVFGSERNFITTGLFYMCIGCVFADFENKCHIKSIVAWMIFLVGLLIGTFTVKPLGNAIIAITLVLLAVNINPVLLEKNSIHIRKLSTGIYLIHFPFIIMFDLYLKRGTVIDFFSTLGFSVAFFFISYKLLPVKIKKIIFG